MQKKNNQKVLFYSRMEKPTAKKSYENCFLCESRNHFFKVFYSSSCLTKKKWLAKWTEQIRGEWILCVRDHIQMNNIWIFFIVQQLKWIDLTVKKWRFIFFNSIRTFQLLFGWNCTKFFSLIIACLALITFIDANNSIYDKFTYIRTAWTAQ